MYAILKQGGRQYRVTTGDVIQVDLLPLEKGAEVELEGVLMVGGEGEMAEVGAPRCDDFKVKAKVLRNARGKKLIVFKFRKRKGFQKKQGHRQDFTELKITAITKGGVAIQS